VAALAALARRDRPWGQWATVAFAVLTPMALAAFVGMVIGLGSPQLTLIAAGSVAGLALLFVPTHAIVTLVLALAIFAVGTAMYYAKVTQAHWIPYALCLFLWIKLPLDALAWRPVSAAAAGLPRLGYLLLALFAVTSLSILIYLYVWSIAFVVAAGAMSPARLRVAILLLLGLVVLQAPFAVQQHFIAYDRTGNWDAIVGTFGGNPDGGGGGSGDMVMFLCFGLALATALWKRGQLRGALALTVVLAATATTMLAETKAFFVFAPAALGVVMVGELRRRPGLAAMMMVVTGLLLAATLVFYKYAYFDRSAAAHRDATFGEYLDYAVSADAKTSQMINAQTGEVSRMGAPLVWLREAGVGGPHGWLIGYGPRASNVSALLGKGEAAKHFAFNLTTSTVTTLLWDIGLLGLAIFGAVIGMAGISAWRLSRRASIPDFHRASLEAMGGAFAVAMASLLYNPGLIDGCATQVFFAFAVGYVMYWQKNSTADGPGAGP